MDERTQQIIEDSEKTRDRNRELENELHGLKVENERLREENEVMFSTQGGANPQNLRDALKWLHDQGGIGAVYSLYKDVILSEAEEALEVLYSEDIEKRLMPEGMEWPSYEDGEPVMFGDCVEHRHGTCAVNSVRFYSGGGVTVYGEDSGAQFVVVTEPVMHEPIKRAKHQVIAADGKPLEVGQTVWHVDGRELTVTGLPKSGEYQGVAVKTGSGFITTFDPCLLTHQCPVLDADRVPIKVGDTVYDISDGTELVITSTELDGLDHVRASQEKPICMNVSISPLRLTHIKPGPSDSWERIEEDAGKNPFDYCKDVGHRLDTCENSEAYKARDIVRRCRALAERGE